MNRENIKKLAKNIIAIFPPNSLEVLETGELAKERPPVETTVGYKGFNIKVYKSPKFGLYWAQNNIGEPYMEIPLFKTSVEAIDWDKENIDKYVEENQ